VCQHCYSGKTVSITNLGACLSLCVVVKLSSAGLLGGISKFVLQKVPISTNKLKLRNYMFSIKC